MALFSYWNSKVQLQFYFLTRPVAEWLNMDVVLYCLRLSMWVTNMCIIRCRDRNQYLVYGRRRGAAFHKRVFVKRLLPTLTIAIPGGGLLNILLRLPLLCKQIDGNHATVLPFWHGKRSLSQSMLLDGQTKTQQCHNTKRGSIKFANETSLIVLFSPATAADQSIIPNIPDDGNADQLTVKCAWDTNRVL